MAAEASREAGGTTETAFVVLLDCRNRKRNSLAVAAVGIDGFPFPEGNMESLVHLRKGCRCYGLFPKVREIGEEAIYMKLMHEDGVGLVQGLRPRRLLVSSHCIRMNL